MSSLRDTGRTKVSVEDFGSSKRIGEKRKATNSPLVANIERVHDAQHEHEINVKSIDV